jgi:hypothetical protein
VPTGNEEQARLLGCDLLFLEVCADAVYESLKEQRMTYVGCIVEDVLVGVVAAYMTDAFGKGLLLKDAEV